MKRENTDGLMNRNKELFKFILVFAIGLVIILTTYFRNFGNVTEYLISNEQKQLLTISSSVADSLERFFEYYERSFKIMTANKTIQEFALDSDKVELDYLADYYTLNNDSIRSIAIILPDETVRTVVGKSGGEIKVEKYLINKIEKDRKLAYSELYEENSSLVMDMYVPYIEGGDLKFLIVVKYDIENLYELLVKDIKVGEKGYASVKDKDGVIIMHPKKEDIGTDVIVARKAEFPDYDWSELENLVELQKNGESGVGTYYSIWYHDEMKERVKKISSYSPAHIGETFWIVTVSMDYLEMTSFIRDNTYKSIVLILIVILLYLFLVIYIYNLNKKKYKLELEVGYSRQIGALNKELEEDIKMRKSLQKKIERNIEKYEKIFNGASDCIFVYKIDSENKLGRFIEVNEKALTALKMNKNQIIEKRFYQITRDVDEKRQSQLLDEIMTAGYNSFEAVLLTSEGEDIYVEINGHKIIIDDEDHIIMISRDITNRKLQEEALLRSNERFRKIVNKVAKGVSFETEDNLEPSSKYKFALELEKINMELEKMFYEEVQENEKKEALMIYQSRMAAMGEMIGNIAHQWRQPLSTLSMLISNLYDQYLMGELDEELFKKKVDKAISLIEHMSKTIDTFRYFFNPKADSKEFSISEVVNYSIEFLSDHMRLSNISVEYTEDSDVRLFGNLNHLSQVLFIVIQNSCDAITENSISNGFIKIESHLEEDNLSLSVSDNGGGVEDVVLANLFSYHFTTKSADKGSGIGLYMCKKVIEKTFNGSILAENSELGLKIKIDIPLGGDANGSNNQI